MPEPGAWNALMRHACLLLAFLASAAYAGDAAAANAPTAEELVILDLLNTHRADFIRGNNRITTAVRAKQVAANPSHWAHAANGTGKSLPLVVSPALTAAARSLLKAGTKPVEKQRFDALPAMKAAGYANDKAGLAMFGLELPTLAIAYAAAATNVTEETEANKQTFSKYAGIEALKAEWREVGIAVGAGKAGKQSVVIVLGQGTAKRHVGGIVYADANRDGEYQLGEGRAGVTVSCGGATMTTGPGGAWWLALDSDAEGQVTFTGDGHTASRPLAKGTANVGIDWRLPNAADLKTADKLIADAEKDVKNPDLEKRRGPLAALLYGTRMAVLDDARQKKVDELVAPIRDEFDDTSRKLMAALGEEPADFKKRFSELQKRWKGGMPGWFKEADAMARLRQQVTAVQAAPADQQPKLAPAAIKSVEKALAEATDPVFLDQYRVWHEALDGIVVAESAKKK